MTREEFKEILKDAVGQLGYDAVTCMADAMVNFAIDKNSLIKLSNTKGTIVIEPEKNQSTNTPSKH